jgi:hypothetical protein
MTEHQAALDRIIAEILRQAGGDADRTCAIADRRWDCGPPLKRELYRMIRITAAGVAKPTSQVRS